MYKTILASAAMLASTAYAATPGSAIVINGCKYDVHLSSVPAQFGGYETTNHVLSPGGTYSQQYTALTNGAGWSIKLAKNPGDKSIMQYEYAYQNDDIIWYDLSCVDGNPWDANWEITSAGDSTCQPRQAAYRYATDDAYGMQSCPVGATITVTLCSGESQNDELVSSIGAAQSAGAAPVVPVAAAPTSTSTSSSSSTTTTPAPAPTTTTSLAQKGRALGWNNKAAAEPTTLTTSTTTPVVNAVGSAKDSDDNVVVVYETVVETAVAYETYAPGKRHVHHPDHPHFR